jgi:hypothetical protein
MGEIQVITECLGTWEPDCEDYLCEDRVFCREFTMREELVKANG